MFGLNILLIFWGGGGMNLGRAVGWPILGTLLLVEAFIYLIVVLAISNSPLNVATWVMWSIIDVYLTIKIYKAGGGDAWPQMAAIAAGAVIITAMALVKVWEGTSVVDFGNKELLAAVAFTVALGFERFVNNDMKVIAATAAMNIAGIPTLIDAWTKFNPDPIFWSIALAGCAVGYFGNPKTISNRFMPGAGTVFNGAMALAGIMQFF
jgi:hypothetical protein